MAWRDKGEPVDGGYRWCGAKNSWCRIPRRPRTLQAFRRRDQEYDRPRGLPRPEDGNRERTVQRSWKEHRGTQYREREP